MELRFSLEHERAQLPAPAHAGDAGLDLRSVEDVLLAPGARRLVRTGLRVAIPPGHAGLVLPRSGLALSHGVTVLNAPGLIDSPYRGELGVLLWNTDARAPVTLRSGERIAQLVLVRLADLTPVAVESLEATGRGAGGFGSTGRE
jgi:dUTP pyrophosphatase